MRLAGGAGTTIGMPTGGAAALARLVAAAKRPARSSAGSGCGSSPGCTPPGAAGVVVAASTSGDCASCAPRASWRGGVDRTAMPLPSGSLAPIHSAAASVASGPAGRQEQHIGRMHGAPSAYQTQRLVWVTVLACSVGSAGDQGSHRRSATAGGNPPHLQVRRLPAGPPHAPAPDPRLLAPAAAAAAVAACRPSPQRPGAQPRLPRREP